METNQGWIRIGLPCRGAQIGQERSRSICGLFGSPPKGRIVGALGAQPRSQSQQVGRPLPFLFGGVLFLFCYSFFLLWLFGFLASWLFGFSASRLLGFLAFRLLGSLAFRLLVGLWWLLVAFWLWLFASSAFSVPLAGGVLALRLFAGCGFCWLWLFASFAFPVPLRAVWLLHPFIGFCLWLPASSASPVPLRLHVCMSVCMHFFEHHREVFFFPYRTVS